MNHFHSRSCGVALALAAFASTSVATAQTQTTTLYATAPNTPRGFIMHATALLLDGAQKALAGKTVKIEIKRPLQNGSVLHTCNATTNAQGYAVCFYLVPSSYSESFIQVTASFAGTTGYASSSRNANVQVTTGPHVGAVYVHGGVYVATAPTRADLDRTVHLTARVTKNGAAVTTGKVRFLANGVYLGLANLSSYGWASLDFTPTDLQKAMLKKVTFGGVPARQGPFEAWYEPPASGTPLPGSRYNQLVLVQPPGHCETAQAAPGTPNAPCSVSNGSTDQLSHPQKGKVLVKDPPVGASGSIVTKSKFTLHTPKPSDPPPDPACNPSVVPAGGCSRQCSRLDYYLVGDDGLLHVLQRASSCTSSVTFEIDPPESALRAAHQRCDERARQLGKTSWNHDTTVSFNQRVIAAYRFYDPESVSIPGGWKLHRTLETKAIKVDLTIPIDVACR